MAVLRPTGVGRNGFKLDCKHDACSKSGPVNLPRGRGSRMLATAMPSRPPRSRPFLAVRMQNSQLMDTINNWEKYHRLR
jgi:hypothetical protein